MFERLEQIEARYEALGRQLADPETIADQQKYQKAAKQHRDLEAVVEKIREMAAQELAELEARQPGIEEELKLLLLPKDPNDEKNVVIEIRAGTGGDEASLF